MAGKDRRFFARWPMTYEHLILDRGQVFSPMGLRNDEKLERLGYMAPLEAKAETVMCSECGGEFIDELTRRGHGDKRHRSVPLTPDEEDRLADREERQLQAIAPLYLENTAASRR